MPLIIVATVLLMVMILANGGQPLRDIGNSIERTGSRINRCIHKVADTIDRVKKIPEKTANKFRKTKEALP